MSSPFNAVFLRKHSVFKGKLLIASSRSRHLAGYPKHHVYRFTFHHSLFTKNDAVYYGQRNAILIIQLQHCKERFLGYFYITDLAHTLFTFLLLFKQFSLTADISAITLGSNIFSHG